MKQPHRFTLATVLALVALLLAGGCADDAATGRISLLLTDAPYPLGMIDAAVLIIDGVSLHVGDDGWHELSFAAKEFDLLTLQNGVVVELANVELPVGPLNEIRLHVVGGDILLSDGREFPLDVPSGASSGLKIKVRPPIQVVGDLTTDVLLDVDLSRSFLPIPAAPERVEDIESFKFHPVVRAANLSTTGSLRGYVLSDEGTAPMVDDVALENATVLVHSAGDSAVAFTDSIGFYRVLGLGARTWTIEAEADSFLGATTMVNVIAGNEVQADSLRLSPVPAKR